VFGVASVIGPLLGGVFVEQLCWHWIFYINIPVGAVALAVVATQVPGNLGRVHHVIDYLGTAALMLAVTCLVLFTSLGGTTYPWGSPTIVGFGVAGAVLLGIFAVVERGATEPVLPLPPFSIRAFSVASFVIAAPIAGIAFLVSWLIPQLELRQGVGASPGPPIGPPDRAIHAGEA
jgi:MFS family permease